MTPSIIYSAPDPNLADFKAPRVKKGMNSERTHGLTGMMLAGVIAALVVLADRLVGDWAGNHVFLGWVAIWFVVFSSMVMLTSTVRRLSQRMVYALDCWARRSAEARAEARFMSLAQRDPRMMAEFRRAQDQMHGKCSTV